MYVGSNVGGLKDDQESNERTGVIKECLSWTRKIRDSGADMFSDRTLARGLGLKNPQTP